MRITQETKDKIESIKQEVEGPKRSLLVVLAALEETLGTKMVSSKLAKIISSLEEWQNGKEKIICEFKETPSA